jgi:hypothetical protein
MGKISGRQKLISPSPANKMFTNPKEKYMMDQIQR